MLTLLRPLTKLSTHITRSIELEEAGFFCTWSNRAEKVEREQENVVHGSIQGPNPLSSFRSNSRSFTMLMTCTDGVKRRCVPHKDRHEFDSVFKRINCFMRTLCEDKTFRQGKNLTTNSNLTRNHQNPVWFFWLLEYPLYAPCRKKIKENGDCEPQFRSFQDALLEREGPPDVASMRRSVPKLFIDLPCWNWFLEFSTTHYSDFPLFYTVPVLNTNNAWWRRQGNSVRVEDLSLFPLPSAMLTGDGTQLHLRWRSITNCWPSLPNRTAAAVQGKICGFFWICMHLWLISWKDFKNKLISAVICLHLQLSNSVSSCPLALS